jgi:small subunit ribosomal protein S17
MIVAEGRTSRKKRLVGSVVSNKMDKTVVVRVERTVRHPRYGKVLSQAKKYKAHDAENACRVGDLVSIVESRPLSREKRWAVEEILKRTEMVVSEAQP